MHQRENLLVWLLIGYIAFFASSQGAMIWVYISEVFPKRGARQRAEPGQLYPLDHERADLRHFPSHGGALRGLPFCLFFAYDGGAVFRRARGLSRDA